MLLVAAAVIMVLVSCTYAALPSTQPVQAAFLGTNGKIAFSSTRDGNYEIYAMNPDGSGVTRLTNNPASDEWPAWSPDSTKIAFMSYRDGNWEIYVMSADGSGVTRLTNNPASDHCPAWSPDGTKIAFNSYRDGNGEIYVMNPDGSNPTRLTNNSADDEQPDWSPDGKKIAFISNRDGNYEIYVMNSDGSGVTRLTNDPAFDGVPAWSPDGKKIVFESDRDGDPEIYVMNSDGSGVTKLTSNSVWDEDPDWQPVDLTPPSISNVKYTPQTPQPTDIVTVIANITEAESGIKTVTLRYSTDGGTTWTSVAMVSGDTPYTGTIPAQAGGTTVQFKIRAEDKAGNIAESTVASYTVKALIFGLDPMMFYILIGVLAAVIVGVAIFFLRSRKPKEAPPAAPVYAPTPPPTAPPTAYCPGCGTPLSPGTVFCPKCGRRLQ